MTEQDKANFKDMINAVVAIYNKPPLTKDVLRIWFAKLEQFDFIVVAKAFNNHTSESSFYPTPADIIKLCKVKPTQYTQISAPKLSKEENKVYADNVVQYITEHKTEEKSLKGMREWAYRITKNPEKYPAISLAFAKEAINAK